MDRGAWRTTVHRVPKSRTRLKRLSTQARTSDHQALSPGVWEPWSYRIFYVAPILVHVWGVMLAVSSRLSFYDFCTCFHPCPQACFCSLHHVSNLNHPHKFRESPVNIASPYPSPVYSVHLVYCLTICPSLLEDLQ